MRQLFNLWKKLVISANTYGVPIPLVHDPKAGSASVSLTLVFISSVLVIIGIVGKWSKLAGDIDMNNAMEFLYSSLALYFGRQWQMKSGMKIDAPPPASDQQQNPPQQ